MRRLFAAAVAAGLAASASAVPPNFSPPSAFAGEAALTDAQAREALEAFREAGPARPYYLELVLRHLPRRGPETRLAAQLWTSRNPQGAVYRLDLASGTHFLLQNGRDARVWRAVGDTVTEVPSSEPLAPGLEATAFDLLRPYLYWPVDGKVTVTRVRGRPADVFFFRAPAPEAKGGIAQVRASLDSEYHAPVEVASLGPDGRTVRTFTLLDLKKAGPSDWLPKDIDVRDESTHNKTRFTLTGAALEADFSPELFAPAALSRTVAAPGGVQRW